MTEALATPEHDARESLRILSRRKFVVIAVVVVCVGLMIAYSAIQTPTYTAAAQVLVPQQSTTSALNPTTQQAQLTETLQRTLADDVTFANGDSTKHAAAVALGFKPSVTITASATSDIVTFAATNSNRVLSARIANAYANAFISARRANAAAQYAQQVTAVQATINQLQLQANGLPPKDPQLGPLQQSIITLDQTVQQLQAATELAAQTGPSVVNAARVPTSPSSPKTVRDVLLALVVSLIIGLGLAFVVDTLDDGIKSRRDVEQASGGVPIIGTIPTVPGWRREHEGHLALVEDSSSPVSEAYRTVRTAIQFLSLDTKRTVLAITSAQQDEGKSTTVANVALSFARAGNRVLAVSGDLRRPSLHQFFNIDNSKGMTSVLVGEASLEEAVQTVGEPRLRVLTSGPIAPNPAEVLSSDRLRRLLRSLAENADLVLIDCPPILPVADALLLSRLVDGVLVVASAESTRKRSLKRAYQLLGQVDAPIMGTVLNRVPHGSAAGYGYDYGYTYEPYESATDPSTSHLVGAPSHNGDNVADPDRLGHSGSDASVPEHSSDRQPDEGPSSAGVSRS